MTNLMLFLEKQFKNVREFYFSFRSYEQYSRRIYLYCITADIAIKHIAFTRTVINSLRKSDIDSFV